MEYSQLLGGTEKCSSSESGWTMYIASPTHDDDGSNDDGDGNDDSDDSLASDASSGPTQHEKHPYGNGKGSHDMAHFKHNEDEASSKYYACQKAYKDMEKKKDEQRKKKVRARDHDHDGIASNDADHAQSGTKVRKNKCADKGK